MKNKKIGILGSGTVGQMLALGFQTHGFEVMIGSRTPEKLTDWASETGYNKKIGTFEETAAFGDIVVLAVKGTAAIEAIKLAGVNNLNRKTVIDTTNPIVNLTPDEGVLEFFTQKNESLLERLQSAFNEIKFVKAFNSVGSYRMVNPDFNGIKPTMFICGIHDNAKSEVKQILELFGWEHEDMGGLKAARPIEQLCILWCIPGFSKNRWTHAFKLLK